MWRSLYSAFEVRAKIAELSARATTNAKPRDQNWRQQRARSIIELRLFQ